MGDAYLNKFGFHSAYKYGYAKYTLGDSVMLKENSNMSSEGEVAEIIGIFDTWYGWVYKIKVKNGEPLVDERKLTHTESKEEE